MTDRAAEIARLSDGERRRLLDGRSDWREDDWQDHCGDPSCEQCDGEMPWPGPNDLNDADKSLRDALAQGTSEQDGGGVGEPHA